MADLKTDLKEVLDAIKNHPTHKYTSLMALGFLEGNGEAILRAIENDERFVKIGVLHRTARIGTHFIQDVEKLPLAIHETLDVYAARKHG